MRKITRARILLIILFMSLGFIAFNDKIIDLASIEKAQFFNGDVKIQTSRFWTLSSFIIDDLGEGNYTWEQAALNDWCSGNGTWNDPYVIENIIINGKNASSCLEIRNSNIFFRIENCTFYNSSGEGIFLEDVNNGRLSNNNISANNNSGIFMSLSSNNIILGNKINYNRFFGICIEECNNNTILGNNISYNKYYGIWINRGNNNSIMGNIINHNKQVGLCLVGSNNNKILGNNASYNIKTGIALSMSISNNIWDNDVRYNKYYGITLSMSINNNIWDNDVRYNKNYGISIIECKNNTILGNNANYNTYFGIYIKESISNTISGNKIHYNDYGIYLITSNNTTISGNNASCSRIGIALGLESNYNTISGNNSSYNDYGMSVRKSNKNTISGNNANYNTYNGMRVSSSNKNIISGNKIKYNKGTGIYIFDKGGDNLLYDNNFINNTIHAKDHVGNNFWNNSVKGNYWDNYTNLDNDYDGIGDIPHYFTGGVDYLPIWSLCNNLTVISPINNSVWKTPPKLKILTFNKLLDSIWYNVTKNPTKFFLYNNTEKYINTSLWNYFSEGPFQISFYLNDTSGYIFANATFTLYKDTQAPIVNLTFPLNGSYFSAIPPSYKVHFNDQFLTTCWYSLNNLNNITLNTKRTLDLGFWTALPDGLVTLRFYTNDTVGNLNKLIITIFKDTLQPSLTIKGPIEQQAFINQVPVFNLDISDASAFNIWYSLNDGRNISCAGRGRINAREWNALPNANIKITFHVQDMAGNLISLDVYIQKESTHNFFIFIIIGIIGGIMVELGTYLKNINTKLKDVHDSPIVTKLEEELELTKFYKDLFAHDITNILSGINLNIELAEKKTKNNDYLLTINKLTKNAIKIISNIRKLTMNDKNHKSVDFIEIKPILYSTITNVKEIFKNRKIDVKSDHIPQDFKVYGNELLLDVFENILHNAVKYTYDKENIVQIEINITKIDESKENFIKLEFRDHGIGIPDIMKKMTFNRTENNHEMGMGIGLSLVKKILNDIGGKIWVEDRIKGEHTRGSNFIVLLRC